MTTQLRPCCRLTRLQPPPPWPRSQARTYCTARTSTRSPMATPPQPSSTRRTAVMRASTWTPLIFSRTMAPSKGLVCGSPRLARRSVGAEQGEKRYGAAAEAPNEGPPPLRSASFSRAEDPEPQQSRSADEVGRQRSPRRVSSSCRSAGTSERRTNSSARFFLLSSAARVQPGGTGSASCSDWAAGSAAVPACAAAPPPAGTAAGIGAGVLPSGCMATPWRPQGPQQRL